MHGVYYCAIKIDVAYVAIVVLHVSKLTRLRLGWTPQGATSRFVLNDSITLAVHGVASTNGHIGYGDGDHIP